MRTLSVLIVLAAVGCGSKEPQPTTFTPQAPQTIPGVVKTWKQHHAIAHKFTADFPFGDPLVRPAFVGRPPAGVVDGSDYVSNVRTRETGDNTYDFGVRAARFKVKGETGDAERTLALLLKGLPPDGWAKSEPKAIEWSDRPATVFTATEPGKSTKLTVRTLTTDAGVYVGYVRDLGAATDAETTRFFNGFHLDVP